MHYEQQFPNSCVAACMCMVQRWRGQDPTEDDFHDGENPLPLKVVDELGRVERMDLDPGEERRIRIELLRGKLVIVFVPGSPYVANINSKYAALTSRHGAMCKAGKFNGPLHAIVLVGCTADVFRYFDPYLAGANQPLEMTNDELDRCFSGRAAIFSKELPV